VSALRASVDAINSEEDFRFKTGQIAAVPQRIEVKSDVSEDEFSRFIPVIVDMAWESRCEELSRVMMKRVLKSR
jgi:NAD-specific glutamate dehydrogenase